MYEGCIISHMDELSRLRPARDWALGLGGKVLCTNSPSRVCRRGGWPQEAHPTRVLPTPVLP